MNIMKRRPSTDHAISKINAAMDELSAVVELEKNEIATREEEIARLTNEIGEASERRDRAARIASRFAAMVA